MITADKINPGMTANWIALVLLFIMLGIFGRPALEWILMKLYEFFIQSPR